MADKIFVSGLYSKDVSDSAPDFILGKLSVQPSQLIAWLTNNRKLEDEKGYINLTVLKNREGKRYIEVDTWKPTQQAEVKPEVQLPIVNVDLGEVPASQLPPF